MAEFPKLKTGAVTQYPAESAILYSTRVLRFLDGSEQRFRDSASALRRWVVKLELLDEEEMAVLEEFFLTHQGALDDFVFVDPADGVEYSSCRLEADTAVLTYGDASKGDVTLVVRQNQL